MRRAARASLDHIGKAPAIAVRGRSAKHGFDGLDSAGGGDLAGEERSIAQPTPAVGHLLLEH
jgi:hypothetical protein